MSELCRAICALALLLRRRSHDRAGFNVNLQSRRSHRSSTRKRWSWASALRPLIRASGGSAHRGPATSIARKPACPRRLGVGWATATRQCRRGNTLAAFVRMVIFGQSSLAPRSCACDATLGATSKPPFWTPLSSHPRLVPIERAGGPVSKRTYCVGEFGMADGSGEIDLKALPKMVRWYSPAHLVSTGWRSIVSELFGQYADQRIMQATIDGFAPEIMKTVVGRYNYSDLRQLGDGDTVWVDYVADLGDGFDSTYAVASLISQPQIDLPGVGSLPAAKLLIMGGDQVYPFPTRQEYRERFAMPYTTALPPAPDGNWRRLLFVLPGNHDWYDGLSSFDHMFCKARFGHAAENRIGGWLCPAASQLLRDPPAAQLVDLGRRHPVGAVPRCRPDPLLRGRRRGDEGASDGSAQAHLVHRRAELELRQGREAAGRGQPLNHHQDRHGCGRAHRRRDRRRPASLQPLFLEGRRHELRHGRRRRRLLLADALPAGQAQG